MAVDLNNQPFLPVIEKCFLAVKNYLISQGVPSRQIDTHGELNNDINPDDASTLFGPLKFGIVTFEEGYKDEALHCLVQKMPLDNPPVH